MDGIAIFIRINHPEMQLEIFARSNTKFGVAIIIIINHPEMQLEMFARNNIRHILYQVV